MPRATIIHNPTAGAGQVTESSLRALALDQRFDPTYATTDEDLDEALQDPGDLVVVAGGDGTVGKVARRLMGRGVPVAVLALGTANNVARGLGMSTTATGGTDALAFDWRGAERRRLDLWTATGPWGKHHFVESFGIGVFAAAIPILSAMKQGAGGPISPSPVIEHDRSGLAALTRASRPLPLELATDAGDWTGRFVLVEALNVPSFGPALPLAPGADPSDGRLELVLAGAEGREALADWMAAGGASEPTDVERSPSSPPVSSRRVRSLSFVWRGEPLHMDGRTWGSETAPWAKVRTTRVGQGAEVTVALAAEGVPVLVPRS